MKRIRYASVLAAALAMSAMGVVSMGAMATTASAALPEFKVCVKVKAGEPSSWNANCAAKVASGEWAKVEPPAIAVVGEAKIFCAIVESVGEESSWENNQCTKNLANGGFIKYESAAANPNIFKATSGAGTLETKHGGLRVVKCTAGSNEGEFTGAATVAGVVVKFTKCTGPLSSPCASTGAKAEEIVTNSLKGKLVYIKTATKEVGLVLEPEAAGGLFSEFTCKTLLGNQTLKVRGSVAGVMTSTNTETKTFTFTLKQSKGVQSPSSYEEGGSTIKTELETEGTGVETFAFEESGEETTATITTTEEGEIAA